MYRLCCTNVTKLWANSESFQAVAAQSTCSPSTRASLIESIKKAKPAAGRPDCVVGVITQESMPGKLGHKQAGISQHGWRVDKDIGRAEKWSNCKDVQHSVFPFVCVGTNTQNQRKTETEKMCLCMLSKN